MMGEYQKNKPHPRDPDDAQPGAKEKPARKHRGEDAERKKALDDTLDRGLEDSFPGSDPLAVTQPSSSARDKHRR